MTIFQSRNNMALENGTTPKNLQKFKNKYKIAH